MSKAQILFKCGFCENYHTVDPPATGGLKSFKLGTTGGLDAATIDALTGVGGTLADFRNATRKSEDELTTLTRQDQLLKLRDDICTIQKKYGVQCSFTPE